MPGKRIFMRPLPFMPATCFIICRAWSNWRISWLTSCTVVPLPAALANVSRIVTVVCMIADIITVITSGKITFFAD